jgi:hypothetical protein
MLSKENRHYLLLKKDRFVSCFLFLLPLLKVSIQIPCSIAEIVKKTSEVSLIVLNNTSFK